MRKIFWFAIIAIWLVVIGYVGYSYFHGPDKNKIYAVEGFVSIGRNYVDGQEIDLSRIKGNDNNAEYLKILGSCFSALQSADRELSKQTSILMVQLQARNLNSPQELDISLQRADDYQKLVESSHTKTEAALQKMSDDMNKVVVNKGLIFDIKGLVESVSTQKPRRDKKFQYYNGLSQYVKATIAFVKSRIGYYKISSDGNYLQFARPVDQNYYNQLISGIGQYTKQIDQYNAEDMNIIRTQVGLVENAVPHSKK